MNNKIDITKEFIPSINKFYKQVNIPNHRYKSWEHCYYVFLKARNNKKNINIDELCLNLAFYLASWGMYRGSSFLLQYDYKIHEPVVRELLKEKYNNLQGIKCKDIRGNIDIFDDLYREIKDIYKSARTKVKEKEIKNDVTDTLCTKVLLGTLGCTPAFDKYFVKGIKKYNISTKASKSFKNYDKVSRLLIELADFYCNNETKLKKYTKAYKADKYLYPQMKILDMGFWEIGKKIS